MADHTLDALLAELTGAVDAARARLRLHGEERWRHAFQVDPLQMPFYIVPTRTADGWEETQVPVDRLIGPATATLSALTVEVDGELRLLDRKRSAGEQRVALLPGGAATHRLRISLTAQQERRGEVRLDGVLLRQLFADAPPARTPAGPRRGKRTRLVLEGEDARRAIAAFGLVLREEARRRAGRRRERVLAVLLGLLLPVLLVMLLRMHGL